MLDTLLLEGPAEPHVLSRYLVAAKGRKRKVEVRYHVYTLVYCMSVSVEITIHFFFWRVLGRHLIVVIYNVLLVDCTSFLNK